MTDGNGFVYAGQEVPGMGSSYYSGFKPKWNGADFMSNFNGGDKGLQYRFWNQAENGYSGQDVSNPDAEIMAADEAAFLGLFACRKQCKGDLGGHPSLRQCIRDCKGKGPKKSVVKGKEAETQAQMAEALAAMAKDDGSAERTSGSSKTIWIIVGIVALIIIGLLIYFLTRKKAVPAVIPA